jgi:hypothetical protein
MQMVVDVFDRRGVMTVISASLGCKRHNIVLKLFNSTLITVAVGALNLGPIQISFSRSRGGRRARRCCQYGDRQCARNIVQSILPSTGVTLSLSERDMDHVLRHPYWVFLRALVPIYVNCDRCK